MGRLLTSSCHTPSLCTHMYSYSPLSPPWISYQEISSRSKKNNQTTIIMHNLDILFCYSLHLDIYALIITIIIIIIHYHLLYSYWDAALSVLCRITRAHKTMRS